MAANSQRSSRLSARVEGAGLCLYAAHRESIDDVVILSAKHERAAPVQLTIATPVSTPQQTQLFMENSGTIALHFQWTRADFGSGEIASHLPKPLELADPRRHTWSSISTVEGFILPNETKGFEFTFQSENAGVFLERWLLDIDPPFEAMTKVRRFSMQMLDNNLIHQSQLPTTQSCAAEVHLHCTAIDNDVPRKRRATQRQALVTQANAFAVEQIVKKDIVAAVNPVYPIVFPSLTSDEAKAFEKTHSNTEFEKMQYSPELILQCKALYEKALAVVQPEAKEEAAFSHPFETQVPNGSADREQVSSDPPIDSQFPQIWDFKLDSLKTLVQAADAKQLESYSAIKALMAKEAEQEDEEEDEPDWTGAKARKKEAQIVALDAAYPAFVTEFRAICLASQISPRDSSFLTSTLHSGLSRMCGETPVVLEIAKHIEPLRDGSHEEAIRRLTPLLIRAIDEAVASDQDREMVFEEARRAHRGTDLANKKSFRCLASPHGGSGPFIVFVHVDLDLNNWFSLVANLDHHVDSTSGRDAALAWKLSERLVEHETYIPPKIVAVAQSIQHIIEVIEASGGVPWVVLLSELSLPPMTKAGKKLEASIIAGAVTAAVATDGSTPKDENTVRQKLTSARDSTLSLKGIDIVVTRALGLPHVGVEFVESLAALEDQIAHARLHDTDESTAPGSIECQRRVLLVEHIGALAHQSLQKKTVSSATTASAVEPTANPPANDKARAAPAGKKSIAPAPAAKGAKDTPAPPEPQVVETEVKVDLPPGMSLEMAEMASLGRRLAAVGRVLVIDSFPLSWWESLFIHFPAACPEGDEANQIEKPQVLIGPQLETSFQTWNRVFQRSGREGRAPAGVALLGGKSLERKLRLIDSLIERVDAIYFVGEIAMTLLRVMYAFHIIKPLKLRRHPLPRYPWDHLIPAVQRIIQKAYRNNVVLLVPTDFTVGDIPFNELGLDTQTTREEAGDDEDEDDEDGNAGDESDEDEDDEEASRAKAVKAPCNDANGASGRAVCSRSHHSSTCL
ncbi:hypothetical protein PINS_up005396 [Pythium insidiosum]|nr:hypothetical protein PINS_up005396 [Pythium insidiosum]